MEKDKYVQITCFSWHNEFSCNVEGEVCIMHLNEQWSNWVEVNFWHILCLCLFTLSCTLKIFVILLLSAFCSYRGGGRVRSIWKQIAIYMIVGIKHVTFPVSWSLVSRSILKNSSFCFWIVFISFWSYFVFYALTQFVCWLYH